MQRSCLSWETNSRTLKREWYGQQSKTIEFKEHTAISRNVTQRSVLPELPRVLGQSHFDLRYKTCVSQMLTQTKYVTLVTIIISLNKVITLERKHHNYKKQAITTGYRQKFRRWHWFDKIHFTHINTKTYVVIPLYEVTRHHSRT